MKKMLFSALMCVFFVSVIHATSGEVKSKVVKSIEEECFAPCFGSVQIVNDEGKVIYTEGYVSNAKTKEDCYSGFYAFRDDLIAKFGLVNYDYHSVISFEP